MNYELFPVPTHRIRQIHDILTEGFVAVEGVRQRHLLPLTVVKLWLLGIHIIAYCQSPVSIKVELLTFSRLHTNGEHQHQIEQKNFGLHHLICSSVSGWQWAMRS